VADPKSPRFHRLLVRPAIGNGETTLPSQHHPLSHIARLHVDAGMPGLRYLRPFTIQARIAVCPRCLILIVAFRPGDHICDIERPYDLEAFEHGADLVVYFEPFSRRSYNTTILLRMVTGAIWTRFLAAKSSPGNQSHSSRGPRSQTWSSRPSAST
jgi:hypothetical protein